MTNIVSGMPGAQVGALIGATSVSVLGVLFLLREILSERRLKRKKVLNMSILMIVFPLFVIIGYVNVPIVLGPACLLWALILGHYRYTNGSLDTKKTRDAITVLLGATMLDSFGLAVLGQRVLLATRIVPLINTVGNMITMIILLFPLLLVLHFFLSILCIKHWRKG